MPEVWKDVLYPGTVVLADGRRITYTPDDARGLYRRARDMLAAGLPIPLCWEHQPGVSVRTPAEELASRAHGTLGHVSDVRLGEGDTVEVKLAVPDEEDARRLPVVRFVSPQFEHDVRDGTGKVWAGRSLTHVAVTHRPIQHRQKPFRRPEGLSANTEWLALGDYDMADGKKDGEEKTGAGEGANLKALVEALRGAGLTIPDEVSTVDDLIIAVKASGGEKPEETAAAPEGATTEAGGPIMMSLQAATARILAADRKDLERRITALKGRNVPEAVRKQLLAALKTEKLSLAPDGSLAGGKLLAQVEAYEALPANPYLPPEDLSALREVPPPDPEEDGKALREEGRRRGREMNVAAGKGDNGKE